MQEKQLDSCSLDDDTAELSGRLLARFSYKNAEQPVASWVEMYQKMLQILYAEDKTIITKLATSSEDGLALHFSLNSADFTKSVENDPKNFRSMYYIGIVYSLQDDDEKAVEYYDIALKTDADNYSL